MISILEEESASKQANVCKLANIHISEWIHLLAHPYMSFTVGHRTSTATTITLVTAAAAAAASLNSVCVVVVVQHVCSYNC